MQRRKTLRGLIWESWGTLKKRRDGSKMGENGRFLELENLRLWEWVIHCHLRIQKVYFGLKCLPWKIYLWRAPNNVLWIGRGLRLCPLSRLHCLACVGFGFKGRVRGHRVSAWIFFNNCCFQVFKFSSGLFPSLHSISMVMSPANRKIISLLFVAVGVKRK